MKSCVIIFGLLFSVGILPTAYSQSQEVKQLLLDVEKLAQLKNILTDLKKGYQIVSGGYTTIKNISQGNFSLHSTFLNSLLEVSPIVKKYYRVADIISAQVNIIKEYKAAFKNLRRSNLFNSNEINYLGQVYTNLFSQSLKNLDALITVITANKVRMSDEERLGSIDDIWKEAENQITFLRHFNNSNKVLAVQRARDQNDNQVLKGLYENNH